MRSLVAALLAKERLQVLVVDFLLLVCQVEEGVVEILERLALGMVSKSLYAVAQRSATGASGEDDGALTSANLARIDDLVGLTGLDDAVLVDAGGMGEGVSAYDGLVGLNNEAGDRGNQTGSTHELTRVDVGMGVELLAVHLHCHDDFFHGGIAGTLTQTVDGTLDLTSTIGDTGQGKRSSHAQVVVAMHGNGGLVDVLDVFHQELDATTELIGQRITGGVGNVHDGSASLDDGLNDLGQELVVRTTSIFAVKLHVVDVLLCILGSSDGALDDLLGRGAELVVDMAMGNADAGVDARALALCQGAGRGIDVLLYRTGKCADNGLVANLGSDLLDGFEVARGRYREARLDDVDVQTQ